MAWEEQIQEVIDKTDMVELVGEFVQLEKYGTNYKGLCPFHSENTPSFVVSPTKKLATCFGCHVSLNPIMFIQKIKNVDFKEALAYTASRVGVKINITSKKTNKPNFDKYYKIMQDASEFYQNNLMLTKSGLEALDYLHKRGLDDETIKKFNIGLAPSNSNATEFLKDQGHFELDISDVGLIKANDNSKGFHDIFIRRIMFPIKDEDGHTIAFSGRIYKEIDKDGAKYVNSPETIIYKKHLNLFNLSDAASYIRKEGRVILHEGQMDVIASCRAGFNEAVCSLGTALTKEQCELLKKYTNNVIICYDADKAGINSTIKAYELLKKYNITSKFILLDGAKDPDEFILKYGISKYQDFINNNIISLIEYKFRSLTKDKTFDNVDEIETIKKELFKALALEKSHTLVEIYLNKYSTLTNISYPSLLIDYNNYANLNLAKENSVNIVKNEVKQTYNILNKYRQAELRLFKYACMSKENALYIDSHIDASGFDKIHQKVWFELIDNYYGNFLEFNIDDFLNMISDSSEVFDTFVKDNQILDGQIQNAFNKNDMNECIDTFNEGFLENEILVVNRKMNMQSNIEEKVKLTQRMLELKRKLEKIKKR